MVTHVLNSMCTNFFLPYVDQENFAVKMILQSRPTMKI